MNIQEFIQGLMQQEEQDSIQEENIDNDIPKSVKMLRNVILSINGITQVAINKYVLDGLKPKDFIVPIFADYPLGSLQRTDGGLENEVLISSDFCISRDISGLKALEFLSWWVRDLARSGHQIQLRALALPPLREQFGNTLNFTIDYFYVDPEHSVDKLLNKVEELASDLQNAKELYLDNSRETK